MTRLANDPAIPGILVGSPRETVLAEQRHIRQSAAVVADELELFRSEAEHYCTLVGHQPIDLRDLLATLLRLVQLGLALPDQAPETAEATTDPDNLDEATNTVARSIQNVIGDHDLYWEVFDPRLRSEPGVGSITDDIMDIYRDLRRGLRLAEAGDDVDAVWEWRFSMNSHWGRHATAAIRVLFRLVSDE